MIRTSSKKNPHTLGIVMSGGLMDNGELPDYVSNRCNYALEIQNELDIIIITSSFSLNVKPKLNSKGFIISEASQCYRYMKKRFCKLDIYCEQFSHDTVGSIFFCLDMYARLFKTDRVIFITSDFHKLRTITIARVLQRILDLEELEIKVIGCTSKLTHNDRVIRERQSTDNFIDNFSSIKTREEFLLYFLKYHRNYNHLYRGSNLDGYLMAY